MRKTVSAFILPIAGVVLAATSLSSHAAEHVISAAGIKYSPMFTFIEPGDQVVWRNMIGHNVETLDSMVPDGTEKIMSDMGANVTATFDEVGIIVYKCTPHWTSRMGGVIVVGQPENAGEIIDTYLARIESDPSALPAKGLLKKLRRELESKGMLMAGSAQ